jgi:hypothetical protein
MLVQSTSQPAADFPDRVATGSRTAHQEGTTMQYDDRRGLMVVLMEPGEGYDDTVNRWYDEEHLAERLEVPGILSARRYVAVEGEPKYLAMYELESPDVVHGEPYLEKKRNPTPLTVEVEAHVTMSRSIYVEITPEIAGGPGLLTEDHVGDDDAAL